MAVPAVTVDIVEKVDAFLTGWGPTRNPEGPNFLFFKFWDKRGWFNSSMKMRAAALRIVESQICLHGNDYGKIE